MVKTFSKNILKTKESSYLCGITFKFKRVSNTVPVYLLLTGTPRTQSNIEDETFSNSYNGFSQKGFFLKKLNLMNKKINLIQKCLAVKNKNYIKLNYGHFSFFVLNNTIYILVIFHSTFQGFFCNQCFTCFRYFSFS